MNPKHRLQAVLNHRTPRHSVIGSQRTALLRSFFAVLLLALLLASPALATSPDDGFNPGADSHVYSLAVQADGKIVVGGIFNMLGGQPRIGIGRLNPDGTLDTAFNPGASSGLGSEWPTK